MNWKWLGIGKMVIGDRNKIRIKNGWNENEKKFFIQLTELLYDKNKKRYAGQEMRVYLDDEFYRNFIYNMQHVYKEHGKVTRPQTAKPSNNQDSNQSTPHSYKENNPDNPPTYGI